MGLLDNIKEKTVNISETFGSDERKFVIRPDMYIDDLITDDYQIWFGVSYESIFDDSDIDRMYSSNPFDLHDEIREFPGIRECSPFYIVKHKQINPFATRQFEEYIRYKLCFGVTWDVCSAYQALHYVYGMCSLLWRRRKSEKMELVRVIYHFNGKLNRTYVTCELFSDFDRFRQDPSLINICGSWTEYVWKMTGREGQMSDAECSRIAYKCSEWYRRTVLRSDKVNCSESDRVINMLTKAIDFERHYSYANYFG